MDIASLIPEMLPDAVGAMVLNQRKQLLVLFHKKLKMWSVPGGKVDLGEDPYDAIARELMEETGLQFDSARTVATRPHQLRSAKDISPSKLTLFECQVSDFDLLVNKEPEKHECFRWMHMGDIIRLARTMLTWLSNTTTNKKDST
jgi:8-oxo-dGTP pyrophosphatase MutT (NUDIX family)